MLRLSCFILCMHSHRKTNTAFTGHPRSSHTHGSSLVEQYLQHTATRLHQGSSGITRQQRLGGIDLKSVVQPSCAPLSVFLSLLPVVTFCPLVHVKLTGGMECVMRNSQPPFLLIQFSVLAPLNPFVFLSLYLHLIDAMSLSCCLGTNVCVVWYCAAENTISTHQSSHLTLHLPITFVPSLQKCGNFYLHAIVMYRIIFHSILPLHFPLNHSSIYPPPPQRGGV